MPKTQKRTNPSDPVERQPEGDPKRFTYHDADREEAEFEGLLDEKGDFQEAVDAARRGEKPRDVGGSTMP
jgi:hypothetical protein